MPSKVEQLIREARDLNARGELDAAARTYRHALRTLEVEAPGHPALAEPLNELALWHLGRDEPGDADVLLSRAEKLLEGEGAAQDLALAPVLASRARAAELLGRDSDARGFNERALALYRAHDGDGASVWLAEAGVLNAQGGLVYRRRRFREAEALFLQALDRLERALGPDDPQLLPVLDNLVSLYRSQGRAEAGGIVARRAEAIRRRSSTR